MWRTLGIDETDWQQTSLSVQTKLRSQYCEIHSLKLRSVFAQKQLASLAEPASHIERLNRRIASQQKQIVQLQEQLTDIVRQSADIARLKAEIAALKEKLGHAFAQFEFAAVFGFTISPTGSETRAVGL
ncbi:MAG: hypothetical protein ACR2L1_08900 [Pyrinomonadaceae bacterium]